MEMVSFDFKSFLILLFSFIGCGRGLNPPEPIEIHTPTSVSSQKLQEPTASQILLSFQFENANQLRYSIRTKTDSSSMAITAQSENIQKIIAKAQTEAREKQKELTVMIKGDNYAKLPAFKQLINALRAKGIFKFQLVSDPK